MKPALIGIGESVHASIPKTGEAMKLLSEMGEDAYTKSSPELDHIIALIKDQAKEQAAYIAVNVDEFCEADPGKAVEIMKEYVKLVRQYSNGVPVCVDSSNDDILIAGLKEWYNTTEEVVAPMVNSIKVHTMEKMYPLKKDFDYKFIGLLIAESSGSDQNPVDEMYEMARKIFTKAMDFGFTADDIFFDSTVFPLAIDMPMNPGQSSYCYNAFETIKKIKADPQMKGVHFSLGVSNSIRDLPGRKIGVCRAYVEVAMKAGLDAAIVNPKHHYGDSPADPELVKMVEAFAALDGDMNKLTDAMTLMSKFCQENRKAKTQ